jgi:hypothetical protein
MQKNTEYDSDALVRLTARLRRRAVFVVVLWLVIGTGAGVYVGFEITNGSDLIAVMGAAAGAFIGYLIGSMRALYYNVQATNALCLKRIEENTRTR